MSTVLDALRKLQREREAQRAAGDTGESVIDLIPLGPPPRSRLLPWVVGASAVLLAAAGLSYSLWLGVPGERWTAALSPGAPGVSPPEGPLEEVSAGPGSSRGRIAAADVKVGAGPALPGEADPGAGALSIRFREPFAREGRPAGDLEPASAASGSAPLGRGDSPSSLAAASIGFPEVRVDQIRWHPEAARREASLRISDAAPVVIREGDIVAGLLVYRIEPAAIELRFGSQRKLAGLGP
ncbi:MAG: hypothetical protein V3R91_06850 [Myxococcota bacterium]